MFPPSTPGPSPPHAPPAALRPAPHGQALLGVPHLGGAGGGPGHHLPRGVRPEGRVRHAGRETRRRGDPGGREVQTHGSRAKALEHLLIRESERDNALEERDIIS